MDKWESLASVFLGGEEEGFTAVVWSHAHFCEICFGAISVAASVLEIYACHGGHRTARAVTVGFEFGCGVGPAALDC